MCHSIDLQTQMLSRQQQQQHLQHQFANPIASGRFSWPSERVWSLWCQSLKIHEQTGEWIQIHRYRYASTAAATATDKYTYQLWRVKWLFCLVIFCIRVRSIILLFGVFVLAPPCSTMTRAETCFPTCHSIRCAAPSAFPFYSPLPLPARIPSQAAFFISYPVPRHELSSWGKLKRSNLALHAAFYSGK